MNIDVRNFGDDTSHILRACGSQFTGQTSSDPNM